MFDHVRNNKKFIQIILAIIMLPFALWGVDSYVRNSGGDEVATVGDAGISSGDFQQALREKQERFKAQFGGNAPAEILESAELRSAVLDELISQRLLMQYAQQAKLRVSDESLVGFITSVPALQENGKFSRERYQALVAAQGMSVEMFEARVRQDMLMQQALMTVGNASVSGRIPAERWLGAQLEERHVSEFVLRAEQFAAGIKPTAEEVAAYYEKHRNRFEKPEQVKVEYLVLNQAKLMEEAKVSDAEVKAWYQANEARYKQAEQRQASHILIRSEKGASDASLKEAQAKVEELLAQLKRAPADFAKLAKQHSQDPGSAEKGGDLGYFGRGMMVKPFEDAVFALKENQVSDVVRSDFGFHIIKLTGIRPERARSFDEVRGEIAAELKRQAGAKLYAESAEGFSNIVYEQPDTLKPAAEKYHLTVQTSDWLAKGGQVMPPLGTPKLLDKIFAEDAIKNRRNTEAVEVGPNTLMAARVVEHRPAALEPLESVTAVIEKALIREVALSKATAAGRAQLEKLRGGEKRDLSWSAARPVSRAGAQGLSREAVSQIFGVSVKQLPVFTGVEGATGYTLYRIDQVKPFDAAGAALNANPLRQQYGQEVAQAEVAGWLASLRQRFPVKVNSGALERK